MHSLTMSARLAPYLRYYTSAHPLDDHGVKPFVLIVLENVTAEERFLAWRRGKWVVSAFV